jgi:hypothetical protein
MNRRTERIDFTHAGLKCLMEKVDLKTRYWWNGYVCVPDDHPLFGVSYSDLHWDHIKVHGGLTFSGKDEASGQWLFGFDTTHCNDCWGESEHYGNHRVEWTLDKLKAETEKLAEQLAGNWTKQAIKYVWVKV